MPRPGYDAPIKSHVENNMTHPTITVSATGHVSTITLNRPGSLNAFNAQQRAELLTAVTDANAHADGRVVIITGAGKGFCAGADLAEKIPDGQTVEQRINDEYKPILLGIAESPKTYIAAVNGVAAGIGGSLALACDLVVMQDTAYLFQAFSAIGLIPDGGISLHLSQTIGPKKAFEVMALGHKLTADECARLGLINRVSAAGQLMDDCDALAMQLCERAPLSLRYTKEVMRSVAGKSLGEAISIEAKTQLITNQSEDFKEGKAAFIEKRKTVWKGC